MWYINDMLTSYIKKNIAKARFEYMKEGGEYFGSIPGIRGVWATGKTIAACRKELQEVLEEWIFWQTSDRVKIKGLPDPNKIPVAVHA